MTVYRVGDCVEVINPEFVVRVGYPMSFEAALAHVRKEFSDNVDRLIEDTVASKTPSPFKAFELQTASDKSLQPIFFALAKIYLRSQGFGGKTRSIHTESRPVELGKIYRVISKRVCKTGTYDAPYACQDYMGEWDTYPGGLTDMKTHVILELSGWLQASEFNAKYAGMWIEARNVRMAFSSD